MCVRGGLGRRQLHMGSGCAIIKSAGGLSGPETRSSSDPGLRGERGALSVVSHPGGGMFR